MHVFLTYGAKTVVSRGDKFKNSILIIGDDTAAGRGDKSWITSPDGIGKYMAQVFANDQKIRQTWNIWNCGIIGSTSQDWLPTSAKVTFIGFDFLEN